MDQNCKLHQQLLYVYEHSEGKLTFIIHQMKYQELQFHLKLKRSLGLWLTFDTQLLMICSSESSVIKPLTVYNVFLK